MLKEFFALWGSIQQLLIQVHAIKGKVKDDAFTINAALKVYKQFTLYGFTDEQMIELANNAGIQKNGL